MHGTSNTTDALIDALTMALEVTGTDMSQHAIAIMAQDLQGYEHQAVVSAIARARREVRGRLTLAAIVERIADGRPTADEAWAGMPRSEEQTVVWTEEAAAAWNIVRPLLAAGDHVGAHVAFIREYTRLAADARAARRPVRWTVSLGWDQSQRAEVIQEAVRLGRLPEAMGQRFLPLPEPTQSVAHEGGLVRAGFRKLLGPPEQPKGVGTSDCDRMSGNRSEPSGHPAVGTRRRVKTAARVLPLRRKP